MSNQDQGGSSQLAEIADLRMRLEEAEETLAAIRSGEVDALVVGSNIFTLESADASSNRLRKDVLAQMEDAVVACDAEDHVIYLNPAAERRYRVTASQILGRTLRELREEQWPDAAEETAAQRLLRESGHSRTHTVHALRGGDRFDAESTLTRLRDADGSPLGVLAVVRDVSERRRAEERLQAATLEEARRERQFSTLVLNSPDIFSRFDRSLRHLYISPVIEAHVGLAPADFLGRTMPEMGLPAELASTFEAALAQTFRTGELGRIGYIMKTVNGERHFESRLIPEFSENSQTESVLAITTDITERRRTESALNESRARLAFALASAGVGEWDLDVATGVASRSLRHDQCFGYAEGIDHWDLSVFLSHVHRDDRETVERTMRDAIAGAGADCHFECRVVWPDRSLHWIEAHGALYRDGDRPLQMLGIVADVTERKTAEETLRNADRSKDEFLATLAHELRNPLAPIRNALQIMRLAREPAVHENAHAVIERQLKQMVHLVDDLMDVSRITQGKIELRIERVDLEAVVQSAVETSRPLIDARRHTLTLNLPPPGTLWVDGDVTRLVQTVANLLNNAGKYTPEGGEIVVSATRQGAEALIAVRDTGVGIHADMLPRLFQMFAQIRQTLDRAQGGLGIGLALVKRLVEMHGGTVQAHSDGEGRGSIFVIRLPAAAVESKPVADAGFPHDAPPGPDGELRVLVVDDNVDSADSLAEMLRLMGFDALTAHDGLAAVNAAEAYHPDVVLLDIGMPLLDGHDAARRIRAQPWGSAMKLIALSGWGQDEDRRKSQDAGFDRHFVKPVDLDALEELLAAYRSEQGK